MSDAGSAGVVMTEGMATERGLEPMVEIVGSATIAGPDVSLHLKPAAAARRVLEKAGLGISDVRLWEINEAFAGVALASARDLGIELDEVNVNGGAIAIGHPLGASGFRIVQTLALEMRRRGVTHGVATMCGGGGQGQALLLRLR
jgi:acetyl-CoA C-acetyltransferase